MILKKKKDKKKSSNIPGCLTSQLQVLDFFINKTFKDGLKMEQVKDPIQLTKAEVKRICSGKLKIYP